MVVPEGQELGVGPGSVSVSRWEPRRGAETGEQAAGGPSRRRGRRRGLSEDRQSDWLIEC